MRPSCKRLNASERGSRVLPSSSSLNRKADLIVLDYEASGTLCRSLITRNFFRYV